MIVNPIYKHIYLASKSPRRKSLLQEWNIDFEVLVDPDHEVDETPRLNEKPLDYVKRMSREKAELVYRYIREQKLDFAPILASDTIVELDGKILQKPIDNTDAFKMLSKLSGRTHHVISAVSIITENSVLTDYSISKVTFNTLSHEQIQDYIQTGEPMDKAGSYAIQGKASTFIKNFEGSYSGIVGLPKAITLSLIGKS